MIGTDSVTENNVMQFLAAIEMKTSEILAECNEDDEDPDGTPQKQAPSVAMNASIAMSSSLDLPSATSPGGDGSDIDSDDGERPFTMKELQESLRAMG